MLRTALSMLLVLSWCAVTHAGTTEAPAGAYTYLISPKHGEVVSSPVEVVFGLSGMGVAPAGIERDGTGHHHLLIDTAAEDGLPGAKRCQSQALRRRSDPDRHRVVSR